MHLFRWFPSLADASGHRPAFAVTVGAAAVAVLVAGAANKALREAPPQAHA